MKGLSTGVWKSMDRIWGSTTAVSERMPTNSNTIWNRLLRIREFDGEVSFKDVSGFEVFKGIM
jgi:hypothetical protein